MAASLRKRIKDGKLAGRLPTLAELSAQYGVSPPTVQKALRILKNEELVKGVADLGTFVRRGE